MRRFRRGFLMLLGTATLLLVPAGAAVAQEADKNCADFATQQEAQAYFDENGGSPENNVDDLDSDSDGVVCEDLPAGEAPAEEPAPEQPAQDPAEGQEQADDQAAQEQPQPAQEQPAQAGDDQAEEEAPGQLPFTGPQTPVLLGAAAAFVIGGLALVVFFRYRGRHEAGR